MKIIKKIKTKRTIISVVLILILLWVYFNHSGSTPQASLPGEKGIVLNSHDLASVKKENFLIRVPISGELYPLEQTTIIAKVGGEVKAAYVREGESIEKDYLLAQLNTADLAQALKDKEAAFAAAKASYEFSLSALKRYKKLLDKKYYSQNDYDAAIQQLRINKAGLNQAEAALKEAKLQLSYAKITSPLPGIVSERGVEPGMSVSVGQTLFKVVNLNHLEWRAMVPADEISYVKVGQTASFTVDGLPRIFSGKVARINPSTVTGTRAYYAYITVDNTAHDLRNGMFATGNIILNEQNGALVIPYEAVKKESTGDAYVFKIDSHHYIQKQEIRLGLTDPINNKAEVLSGLNAGELIIASSAEMQAGDLVILPAFFSK